MNGFNKLSESWKKIISIYNYAKFVLKAKDSKTLDVDSLAPKILTSKEEIKKIKPYLSRIKNAIDSKRISNIALTGSYGSGKSTILKTFQNIYKAEDPSNEYKYLNISLASFKKSPSLSSDEKPEHNDIDDQFERQIELSILQQMIYRVKPQDIPDSRFKRIVNLKRNALIKYSFAFIIWLLSALIIFQFQYFQRLNPKQWSFSFIDLDYLAVLLFVIFFFGIAFFTKKIIRALANSKINKISLKGELELGEDISKSILNQHVDEILYFFERTDFNVVIIEDLDRFKSTDIFTKLREINLLLNSSDLVKRHIVFLYAIKDDMFHGKERVKFFDFIIPIIPFINPSNANEQLTNLIIEAGLTESFSQGFIEDVVTYIDDIDMRLLRNIFHEYVVYNENLGDVLNQDNLLAMIIYKNIYPNDFANLSNRKGALYEFFKNKHFYIKELIDEIDDEILSLKEFVDEAENHHEISLKELRAVYVNAIRNECKGIKFLNLDGRQVDIEDLTKEENFDELIGKEKVIYRALQLNHGANYYLNNTQYSFSFLSISKSVSAKYTYEERADLLKNKKVSKIEELKRKIEDLRERRSQTETLEIKQIFEETDINPYLADLFKGPLNKYLNLVKNLLINGYINENYDDYISLFHGVNIPKSDFVFVRNVKSNTPSPFDYKLYKIENLQKKISAIRNYNREAILNIQLFDYLLSNRFLFEKELKSILQLLSRKSSRSISFIDAFVLTGSNNIPLFFKLLIKEWSGFWTFLESESKYPKPKINSYLKAIILHADIADIQNNNIKSNFSNYISQKAEFATIFSEEEDTKKVERVIATLNIKFEKIDTPETDFRDLYEFIIKNNYYTINHENLKRIIKESNEEKDSLNQKYPTYENILNSGNPELLEYVEENIEKFANDVLLKLNENFDESERSMISLLNNTNLEFETKISILENSTNVFQNLSKITEIKIKKEILRQFSMVASWKNVLDYYNTYEENDLDEVLIDYINNEQVYINLSGDNLNSLSVKEELKKEFALSIIYCDSLSLESHENVRKLYYTSWKGLDLKKLSFDKVKSMIDKSFISVSSDYFEKLKENFSNLQIALIEKDIDTYLNFYDEYNTEESDYVLLLKSESIADSKKAKILNKLNEEVVIANKELSALACHVFANVKAEKLGFSYLSGLFSNVNSVNDRIRLFISSSYNLSTGEAKQLLAKLPDPYSRFLIPKKRTRLIDNDTHRNLVQNLSRLNLISSFKSKGDKIEVVSKY